MGHRRPRKNARSRLCQPTQDRQDSARISARNVSRPHASSRPRRVSRSIEQHHQGSLFAVPFRDRAAAFAIMPSMASGLRTGCRLAGHRRTERSADQMSRRRHTGRPCRVVTTTRAVLLSCGSARRPDIRRTAGPDMRDPSLSHCFYLSFRPGASTCGRWHACCVPSITETGDKTGQKPAE